MDLTLMTRVGPVVAGDGNEEALRAGRDGGLVVNEGRPRFAEYAARGLVFAGMTAVAGTTVVAANNSPIAAAAATVLSLYNPIGSGVDLELLKAWLNHISGTPAAGAWVYNVMYNQTITAAANNGGTAGATPVSSFGQQSPSGRIFTQTALTGGVNAQVLYRPFGSAQFAGALAATTPGQAVYDPIDGEIVLPPGGLLSIASPGTGTTHIVAAGLCWLERTRSG